VNLTCDDKIAGVVVLYHPAQDVANNIRSYLGDLARLYLVDNSPVPSDSILAAFAVDDRISYHSNQENLGVAAALNLAAAKAVEEGYRFLLTMDQDSCAESGMVGILRDCLVSAGESVAMVVPFLVTRQDELPAVKESVEEIGVAMTSGSLLKLSAYKAVGPFREDFFIDFVDVEYCLRLRKQRFTIIRDNYALLHHAVGDKIGIPGLRVTSHIPVRTYYKTRNRMLVWKLYSESFSKFCRRDRFRFILEIGRIFCCEPHKTDKLRMIFNGFRDFRAGRMGRYEL
jgi:rhamnosyltransferase